MEAAQMFVDAFDRRREAFLERLKTCRQDFSESAVHDLRVASRRLIAFVEVAHMLDSEQRPPKVRRQLKDLIDNLDGLRDAQAMLAHLDEHARAESGLVPLRLHLLEREQELLGDAHRAIRSFGVRELKDRLKRLRARVAARLGDPDPALDPLAAVDQAYARVLQCDAAAGPDDTASIHRVRLAFKKFRYRFEIVQPALAGLPPELPAQLHTYQTIVGRVQDAETFLALVDTCAAREPTFDAMPARAFYAALRAEAIDRWLANRSALAAFWRAGPELSFPWRRRRRPRAPETP